MKKKVQIKDGQKLLIRSMTQGDVDRSLRFFKELSVKDRMYLRRNVIDKDVIKERIREIRSGNVKRLVALHDENIVADGALEKGTPEWKSHIGELRLIVARPYRRKGVGMLMARELYFIALKEKIEQIVVKIMKPQDSAIKIFKELGFKSDAEFPRYVKDQKGSRHGLIVMRCNVKSLWKELEDYFINWDIGGKIR
jgi:L-amino acid N-acyltransferase YncA